jgi:hypothetical protein
VRVTRVDRTSLVAGVVIVASGILLLLDQVDAINLRFGYAGPLLIAVIGAILLTAGLEGPLRDDGAGRERPPRDDD